MLSMLFAPVGAGIGAATGVRLAALTGQGGSDSRDGTGPPRPGRARRSRGDETGSPAYGQGELDIDVRYRMAVHLGLGGSPDERVLIHGLIRVRGGPGVPVGQHALTGGRPALAVALPDLLAELARRVEHPGAHHAVERVQPTHYRT
jgi:hypothetical protein